jgi:hypothetical protein
LRNLAEDNHARANAAIKEMKEAQEELAKNRAQMKGYEERLKNEVLAEYKAKIRGLEGEKAELERMVEKLTVELNYMKGQC